MGNVFTLLETIAKIETFKANLKLSSEAILTDWAVTVRDRARKAIGTYKYGWPSLGPEAVAKHGDTPLLDTGELRDSISAVVKMTGPGDGRAAVGSDLEKAVWHELGTKTIPPRSFLMESAVRSEKDLNKIVSRYIAAAWASARHGGEILALLHALKIALEIAHHVIGKAYERNAHEQ
jgi:phage gpG-like protein